MDLIYSVSRKFSLKSQSNSDWMHEGNAVCVISSRNTIAFTSRTKVDDSVGKSWRCHVYVADLNLPWDVYRALSHNEEITCLEWDTSGSRLLVADKIGQIQIWMMKDYLLNDWFCFSTSQFPGEHILCAAWFHNGKKIVLNNEKKDSPHYTDKFLTVRFGPSIRHTGGRPREGCIAIGATGMICVVLLSMDGTTSTSCDSLGLLRTRLKVVDLCYGKNGDFLIAASDGSMCSAVHCYKVTLKIQQNDSRSAQSDGKSFQDKCVISSQSLPGFYPSCFNTNASERSADKKITHLRFVVREAADAVVVCASGNAGSIIELWELREKQIILNKMFLNTSTDNKLKTVSWQHHASQPSPTQVVALTTPRTSLYDSNPPPSYILAAYRDNSIKCFYRESLQFVFSITINPSLLHREEAGGIKHVRIGTTISDMQLTWTGSTLIALDSLSQIYLYRLSPITDPGGPVSVSYAVALFEYCLITGIDWWDILLGLRAQFIDQVCEKLTDSFNRQLPSQQQYLFFRFLTLKMSLYRCLNSGQNKAGDCSALLMLNAVATAFKSMLRPADLSSQDRGPAENLTVIMSGKPVDNITDVMIHLENKEFIVESATLQSMQQLIQWVADFSLYLLASLPQQTHSLIHFPGCGLINDLKALNTLRELLVIITMWGFIKQSCLPTFTKTSDSLDVLALLFRLLSKALQCGEPDDSLLDECCLLPSQVLIPALTLGVEAKGVTSPALFQNSLPLPFEYCSEPPFMNYRMEVNVVEGAITTNQFYDNVRHTYLGCKPSQYKQCARCSCVSMLKNMPKSTATKAWDQRWARTCPCGGHWKLANG
uniref:Mediator of RNA polymerase II transcription subunit 16 n=1 Tax=Strigamia maritima TaxID=126957 RepID=T1IRP9_STRMM